MFGRPRDPAARRHPWLRLLCKFLIMLVIFLAGGISGALYGIDFSFRQMRDHAEHMDELPDNVIPRLAEDLALTPTQLEGFDRVFRNYHSDIARVEGENAIKVHQLFYDMGKEILPLLDETQAAQFREVHRKICTVFLPPLPKYVSSGDAPPVHPCEGL